MPNRVIKDSIKRSPQIDSLTWFEEVVFFHMILTADDYGCLDGRTIVLKNDLFPTKETVTKKAIEEAVSKLASVGLLRPYEVNGMPYLFFPTWEKHQRIRNKFRKYPEPPPETSVCHPSEACQSIDGQMSADCSDEVQSESESKILKETPLTGSKEKAGAKTGAKAAGADAPDRAFDTFWAVYPRRENKQAARKAFVKIHPDPELLEVMLSAVQRQKQTEQWSDPKYIPHAATWLNGRRWEDEPVKAAAPAPVKQVSAQRYTQRDYDEQELEKRLGVNDLFAKQPKEAKA